MVLQNSLVVVPWWQTHSLTLTFTLSATHLVTACTHIVLSFGNVLEQIEAPTTSTVDQVEESEPQRPECAPTFRIILLSLPPVLHHLREYLTGSTTAM